MTAAAAGVGAVLASLASAAVNEALVARFSRSRALTLRAGVATLVVLAVGLGGVVATARWVKAG